MSEAIDNVVPESAPEVPAVPPEQPVQSVWQRRLRIIGHFLAGQSLVQGLNFIIGFLLLRWMDKTAYAQYAVAFAFQSTVGSLVDLGFTGSIVALVGEQAKDPEVVGRYIRSARHYRFRSFLIVMVFSTIAYPFVVMNQPWGWHIKALLYVGIVGGLLAQNLMMYASALLIARELTPFYRAQIISSLWRQAAHTVMYFTGTLYSWAASWVSAAAIAIYGGLYYRSAKPLIREPAHADPATNRRMLRYLIPQMPGVIFAAFQAHILVAIIALLGKTDSVAEVGALGRLGQLFMLLQMFNSVIVEPYIARVSRRDLPRRYAQVIISQVLVGGMLVVIAFLFPGLLLWVIGPKYEHLRKEVGWVAMQAAISYVCGGLWTMHSARKWVYGWGTALYICMLVITQVIATLMLDLSTTHGVIYFGVITATAILFVHIANGIYGFRYGPPKRVMEGHAESA